MEETRLAMQKRADSGLPGSFRSRWQENNPRSVPNAGFVQRVPNLRWTSRWTSAMFSGCNGMWESYTMNCVG